MTLFELHRYDYNLGRKAYKGARDIFDMCSLCIFDLHLAVYKYTNLKWTNAYIYIIFISNTLWEQNPNWNNIEK